MNTLFIMRISISFFFPVFYILFGSVHSLFECPIDSDLKPIDGTFRDPNNCAIYYQCINGTSHPQACPPGLHFKLSIETCSFITCVDPSQSDCIQKSSKMSSRSSKICEETNPDNSMACYLDKNVDECFPNKNETVVNGLDCRVYYHCVNGVAWPQRCPTGYYFTPTFNVKQCGVKMCVPSNKASCSIPGGWSNWSGWTDCNALCGKEGIRIRTRQCSNPPPSNGGTECQGNSLEVDECKPVSCGNNINPAFMVSLSASQTINSGRMAWTSVDINELMLFDQSDNSLNIRNSGMYFFSITATMDGNSDTSLSLQNVRRTIGLAGKNYHTEKETITRGGLFSLNSLYRPNIFQNYDYSRLIGSGSGKETSWLGFHYESDHYLFAGRDSPTQTEGIINLPNIMAIRGFSVDDGSFQVREAGYYFVNFGSTHASINSKVSFTSKNNLLNFHSNIRINAEPNTTVIQSISFIRRADVGDKFNLLRRVGEQYSSSYNEIYLCSFKLNESLPIFSIYENYGDYADDYSLVKFHNNIIVDTQNAWQNNIYVTPITGTYYVAFNIPNDDLSRQLEIYIDVNGNRKSTAFKVSNGNRYSGFAIGGAIMKLLKNDQVKLMFKGHMADSDYAGTLTIILIP